MNSTAAMNSATRSARRLTGAARSARAGRARETFGRTRARGSAEVEVVESIRADTSLAGVLPSLPGRGAIPSREAPSGEPLPPGVGLVVADVVVDLEGGGHGQPGQALQVERAVRPARDPVNDRVHGRGEVVVKAALLAVEALGVVAGLQTGVLGVDARPALLQRLQADEGGSVGSGGHGAVLLLPWPDGAGAGAGGGVGGHCSSSAMPASYRPRASASRIRSSASSVREQTHGA